MEELMNCVICDYPIGLLGENDGGHNADPVAAGRCCGMCNDTQVIPARLALARRRDND